MIKLTKPVGAKITLSEICNQKCTFCYNQGEAPDFDEQRRIDYQRLPMVEYEIMYSFCQTNLVRIIDILGENEFFYVKFTGGEPLATPTLLLKGMEACKRHRMKKIVNTNLSMLSPEVIRQFHEYELDRLNITFLSCNEETYNSLTQSRNYKKVLRNLRIVLAEGFDVEVGIPVAKENLDNVYQTIEFLKTLGVTKVSVFPVDPARRDQIPLMPVRADLETILRQMKDADSGIVLKSVTAFPLCFVIDNQQYSRYLTSPCRIGTEEISFSLNGDIKGCTATTPVYGNIIADGFTAVLKVHELFKRDLERKREMYPQLCQQCELIEECSLGCKASNEGITGNIYGENRFATGPKKQSDLPVKEDDLPEGKNHIDLSRIAARRETDKDCLVFSLEHGIGLFSNEEIRFIERLQELTTIEFQKYYQEIAKKDRKIRKFFIKLNALGMLW